MTKATKPVRRETFSCFRGRPLVIEIHPTFVTIREKGRRSHYSVTFDQIFNIGARNAAAARRAEKAEAKKAASR